MSTITKSPLAPDKPMDGDFDESIVGIFWDYEVGSSLLGMPLLLSACLQLMAPSQSCPSPSKQSLESTINVIETLSKSYGSIHAFNVYIDLNRHPEARQAAGLRQPLYDSVISLLDCPGGGKTIADKKIIVDLFAFAIRNRKPSTLTVLSTDPDLAYTLSLLRQRMFKVVLVTSGNSTSALKPQADACFDWSSLVPGSPLSSRAALPDLGRKTVAFTKSSVPKHLHEVIAVLIQASRADGWPEVGIYGYLAEGVQLGIFVKSVGLSYSNVQHTYYALTEAVRKDWE
ncbi:hypothetical protein FRB90_008375 [Tulasnella sp. 427]|nr:hypothetical protein FRB90_008375 [Tulasnella sp. 427]